MIRLVPVLLAAFLMDIPFGVMGLAVPVLVERMGGNLSEIGILAGMPMVSYTIACLLFARAADRFPAHVLLGAGALGFALLTLPVWWIADRADDLGRGGLPLLYLFLPAGSACMGIFWPTLQKYMAEGRSRADLNWAMQKFNMSWCLGLTVGMWTYGWQAAVSPSFPFAVMAATPVVTAILCVVFLRQPLPARLSQVPLGQPVTDLPDNWRTHLTAGRLANFSAHFIAAGSVALFTALAAQLGMDKVEMSSIEMLRAGMELVAFTVLGYWHAALYRKRFIAGSLFPCALGAFAIALGESSLVFRLGFTLIGLGVGGCYHFCLVYSLYGQEDKGRKSGIHEAMLGSGIFIGPVVCGAAGHQFGIRASFVAAGLVGLATLVWIALLRWNAGSTASSR